MDVLQFCSEWIYKFHHFCFKSQLSGYKNFHINDIRSRWESYSLCSMLKCAHTYPYRQQKDPIPFFCQLKKILTKTWSFIWTDWKEFPSAKKDNLYLLWLDLDDFGSLLYIFSGIRYLKKVFSKTGLCIVNANRQVWTLADMSPSSDVHYIFWN